MPEKSILFTSQKLGNLKIINRVVRSATWMGRAKRNGEMTYNLISVYEKLAKNNIGLIITGFMFVSKKGKAAPHQAGIHEDFLIPGLKNLVSRVKEYDEAKIFAQIAHGGKQLLAFNPKNFTPLAPSAIKDKLSGIMPKKMSIKEIKEVINDFIQGARRSYESGFDGVQLHIAHGYLLSEFISPYCNKRNDEYGGSVENRFRIIKDIIIGIQDELGKDYPIAAKLNVADFVKEEPQLTIEESKKYAKKMADLGIAAIETSGGLFESAKYGNQTASRVKIKEIEDEAYFFPEARIIKNEIGDIPVILVGGIRSREMAEKVLNEGMDFIAISRPFIREPDLLMKWKNSAKKSDCISCNRCLFSSGQVICHPLKKLERKKKREKK
ncbi:MAG: NADH:flavin oxidoreductase [Candidatus Lokiarchaeota archaeon]|nr:NADH:flavin oxidoreductase [Candidatus Lokiarchaeota archaeon]